MSDLKGKNILFICPDFYDYPNEIVNALRLLGADVTYFPEMNIDFIFRLKKNLNKRIFQRHLDNYYNKILQDIKDKQFDYFFLIKGYYITRKFVLDFCEINKNCTLINYQWDSLKSVPNSVNFIDLFHQVYSFDPKDSAEHPFLSYLSLFCVDKYFLKGEDAEVYKYDLLFIGSLTYYRYKILTEIREICNREGVTFCCYAYIPMLEYLKERYIRKHKILRNDTMFKKIRSNEIIRLYNSSNTILDIPDINQSGYPIRIFEALGAKKKIITTSSNIDKEQFYSESNIYKLDNGFEGMKAFIKSKGEFKNINIYSTQTWIRKIFRLD